MMHFADSLTFSGRKVRAPSSCAAAVLHIPSARSVFQTLLCHQFQVVAAWAALPFPALSGSSLPDILSAHQQELPWKFLSSWREQKVSCCFAQSVVLRGICQEKPAR